MNAIKEVTPWREARVRCGIGHVYRGRVRQIQRQAADMDGECFWQDAVPEYDPPRCVVCGLYAFSEVTDGQ